MGLSFLNKKIWHPGSFANMEKTWVTEQRYREVEIRAIEKAKKIKEEKVIEEMKKIQVDKGLIPASQLNRLDFMYQCPDPEATQKSNPNEDFLLGKRLDDNTDNIFMKNKIQKKNIVPMFADNYANPKNEDFVRIHEDPLYLILKEEQKQRKEIEQNPYKMKMILNDIKNGFRDSQKLNTSFDTKKEILYDSRISNKNVKLKEDDENKKSLNLREKSSSGNESETEKALEKEYRRDKEKEKEREREREKRHRHRDKHSDRNYSKYKEDHYKRHEHRHKHRDKNREEDRHRNSDKKYYY